MTTDDNTFDNNTSDSWADRYQLVADKLSAFDARLLLDLIDEDLDRLVASLESFTMSDDDLVYCECSSDLNPECPLGDHSTGHLVPAQWRVSPTDDYADFRYLCTPCKESFAARPVASEYSFEVLGDETHAPTDHEEDTNDVS